MKKITIKNVIVIILLIAVIAQALAICNLNGKIDSVKEQAWDTRLDLENSLLQGVTQRGNVVWAKTFNPSYDLELEGSTEVYAPERDTNS